MILFGTEQNTDRRVVVLGADVAVVPTDVGVELTDIFVIQDEVTQEIVAAMALKLSADDQHRVTHRITDHLEA